MWLICFSWNAYNLLFLEQIQEGLVQPVEHHEIIWLFTKMIPAYLDCAGAKKNPCKNRGLKIWGKSR
jgi:hypothetical protein